MNNENNIEVCYDRLTRTKYTLPRTVDPHDGSVSYGGKFRAEELYLTNPPLLMNSDINPVCIAHFHGASLQTHKALWDIILEHADLSWSPKPEDLEIITCWTDPEKCGLLKQSAKWGFKLKNAIPSPSSYIGPWRMTDKIDFYIQALQESTAKYVLLLDGYDTLIVSFEDLIRKFEASGKNILFNATRNNYPNVNIDFVPDRSYRGAAKFFNAGAAIGYREDLLKFYKEAKEYLDIPNPCGSEQFVIRHAFANYSGKLGNTWIDYDYKSSIFQLLCRTAVIKVRTLNSYIVL